jgi:hypothetical protein
MGLSVCALLLSACGGASAGNSDAVLTEAAQIAFQALTETAAVAPPTATPTPIPPTATPTPAMPTFTPTVTGTLPTATTAPVQQQQQPAQQQSGNTPCLRANLEIETIPDGTEIDEGRQFTKTWRLKNTGSCTWTAAFSGIWVQGDLMKADSVVPLTTVDVPPGDYAMLNVKMEVPSPGGKHYKGYWMLRSSDGNVFGIGVNGKEWFWVDVLANTVVDEDE